MSPSSIIAEAAAARFVKSSSRCPGITASQTRCRRGLPAKRQITVGTMLAIDPETRAIRAKLTSDLGAAQCADRDQLLSSLVEEGLVRFGRDAIGPDGQPLRSVLKAEFMDGLMCVRNGPLASHRR